MAFKFLSFCAMLVAASAGGLFHHPVAYTQYHNVAVAHSASDEDHQNHHRIHYSQEAANHNSEGSHIHYVPAYAKTIHFAAPAHSSPVYTAPAFAHHVTYGAQSYGRSLGFNEGPSSTPAAHASEETTTAESTTTESSTTEAESTEQITHASKSAESEPTQASYKHESVTPTGYRYDAPSASSSSYTHSSGVPTIFKYHTSLHHAGDHHAPSAVKYEVPAQTVVKYAAPTNYAAPHQTVVHYAAPAHHQTVYHKPSAPEAVHIKYATPEAAVYTSFGEHPPAVYSHYTAPAAAVHHTYTASQPGLVKYAAPASAPGHVTYIAPAPAVYTKYGVTESSHASHVAPAPTTYIKYGSPAAATTYTTTYSAPHQHSSETSSNNLIHYQGSAKTESSNENHSSSSSSSSSAEENKDSVEIKSPENSSASHQESRAYLPPATHLVSHTYPVHAEQYNHQESARSHSNEHNIWSTDGAASHVSFKGFGTEYAF